MVRLRERSTCWNPGARHQDQEQRRYWPGVWLRNAGQLVGHRGGFQDLRGEPEQNSSKYRAVPRLLWSTIWSDLEQVPRDQKRIETCGCLWTAGGHTEPRRGEQHATGLSLRFEHQTREASMGAEYNRSESQCYCLCPAMIDYSAFSLNTGNSNKISSFWTWVKLTNWFLILIEVNHWLESTLSRYWVLNPCYG